MWSACIFSCGTDCTAHHLVRLKAGMMTMATTSSSYRCIQHSCHLHVEPICSYLSSASLTTEPNGPDHRMSWQTSQRSRDWWSQRQLRRSWSEKQTDCADMSENSWLHEADLWENQVKDVAIAMCWAAEADVLMKTGPCERVGSTCVMSSDAVSHRRWRS